MDFSCGVLSKQILLALNIHIIVYIRYGMDILLLCVVVWDVLLQCELQGFCGNMLC